MFRIDEKAKWADEVHGWSENDFVEGGYEGVDNIPLNELANRTAFLKNQFERLPQRAVGELHELAAENGEWELAKCRYLPLHYEIIEIALYQELCEKMYCGDEYNNTAYFWYKCNDDGTRNVNGQYMRVADYRGMFTRGAGVNEVFKGANNTPLRWKFHWYVYQRCNTEHPRRSISLGDGVVCELKRSFYHIG
jgi:hypothetical protein